VKEATFTFLTFGLFRLFRLSDYNSLSLLPFCKHFMKLSNNDFKLDVTSEIGNLRALLIHSPDNGLGKVVPSKAQDWLFEDIVHLETMRKNEYDFYVKLLLYFLDPVKIKGKLKEIDSKESNRAFYKPDNKAFHCSDKVI